MKRILSENSYFIVPYLLFALLFGIAILCTGKGELHLWLNSVHTPTLDFIFKYITLTGEWIPYVVAVALLFYKTGNGIFVLLGQLSAGLVTQIIKHIVDAPRPKLFFAEHYPDFVLPLVDGVRLHSSHSFPSGHTTAIFALFFSLAVITKNKPLKFIYLLLAIFCSYSRIYLFQHFPCDVWAGSMIAVITVALLALWSFPLRKTWSDKPITKLRKKQEK